jgi:SAM-dependent methyltransferase
MPAIPAMFQPAFSVRPGARDIENEPALTKERIEEGLKALAPFHHAIELPFGLNTYDRAYIREDRGSNGRLETIKLHLWPELMELYGGSLKGKRILDVACNCGGFSFLSAQSGAAEVLGIDSEEEYIAQAQFLKKVLDEEAVRFRTRRLEELSSSQLGQFDVTLFFGILYHVEDPIGALKKMAELTCDTIVVDTHVMKFPYINRLIKGPMWKMKVVEPIQDEDTTTGLWRRQKHCQFYPNKAAVIEALKFAGFEDVRFLEPKAKGLEQRYYRGTRGVFIGRKGGRVART